jgi:NAD(P)-dependent dehydrogenase (short-subunit alcohol dehydrogenase family)
MSGSVSKKRGVLRSSRLNNVGWFAIESVSARKRRKSDAKADFAPPPPFSLVGYAADEPRRSGFIGSEFEKFALAQTPLGRIGQPSDIASIAVFLASEDSAWLTGERLLASGGFR